LRTYGGLQSEDVEIIQIFEVLLKNDTLRENFQNCVPKGFIATPIDVLCSNFVKFGRREIGKMVRCLPDKKALQLSLLRGSRPRSARASSRECTPDFIQIGSPSVGGVILERVNTVKARSKVNPRFR